MNFSRPVVGITLVPLLVGLIFGVGTPAFAVENAPVLPGDIESTSEVEAGPGLNRTPGAEALPAEAATLAAPVEFDEGDADALPPLLDSLLQQGGATIDAPIAGGSGPTAQASSPNGYTMWPGSTYVGNFADPFVLPVVESGKTVYYAFATNAGSRNLPVLRSTDLKTWKVTFYSSDLGWADRNWASDYAPFNDNAIPQEIRSFNYLVPASTPFKQSKEAWLNADGLASSPAERPSWARKMAQNTNYADDLGWRSQETWAPAVAKLGNTYYAYMSVRARDIPSATDRFCIAVATSKSPAGPYRYPSNDFPVVCPTDRINGVIDPEPIQYKGNWYLLWKSENSPNKPQGLHAQRLNPATGRILAGSQPVDLLLRDSTVRPWEVHAIENPSMATIGGTTYLFYSGGQFWADANATSAYATGYAVCPQGPTAPCVRGAGDNRLLASVGSVQGPGGGSVFQTATGDWKFSYHAYQAGGSGVTRQMRIANIYQWPGGGIAIADGAKPRFADVPAHQQFYRHIMWLAELGITTGDKKGNFRPVGSASRADMAAFLYRYAGSPKYTPKGAEPFADVNKNTKFYKEIRWMHANGLTTGVKNPKGGKPNYSPQTAITREAMAAFFYRLSGTKGYSPKGAQPLVDVNRASKFYREIRWMYDNGITTGIDIGGGKHRFNSYGQTNRDAFAAFLMRYDEKFGK